MTYRAGQGAGLRNYARTKQTNGRKVRRVSAAGQPGGEFCKVSGMVISVGKKVSSSLRYTVDIVRPGLKNLVNASYFYTNSQSFCEIGH